MLAIHELVKVYPGPVTALAGVSFTVERGLLGLLGANGAGKSTLMKIIAGLLEPTSGRVELDGVDITAQPARVWSQLGYLPQDFGFYAHLTGAAMLEHLLALKGVDAPGGRKALVAELLAKVNLADAAKRKVKGYSGGMRQRLGIAQAIAGSPRLLIVDEPTAGLDPEERLRFYDLLAELAADRIVLLSTHIVEDVAVLCPRLLVIRGGRVLADTAPAAARQACAGTMFEGRVTRAELDTLRASARVTQSTVFEGVHRARLYVPDGAPPAGFEPSAATLEDFYLALARGWLAPDRLASLQSAAMSGAAR
ncbi:MAG: ATP-binding cassette domain-containing protein [Planctomycetes bacterium]|nr:ATP-binding cassette domain-containing protein [Planctomycetota bacterium]